MAFRELHVLEIKEILRLWSVGHGLRLISRRTGADRKTVRRYVEAAQEAGLERGGEVDDEVLAVVVEAVRPGAPSTVGPMRAHLRAYAEPVRNWATKGCEGPKLVKLVKRKTGVPVPLRTMQRFVAEDLGLGRDSDTVRIVDPPPGVLEVDFLKLGEFNEIGTGETQTMYALLCTAGCSRHQFVWPCLSQTFEDVVDGLEQAWDFFGGVFPVLLPDNMKAIVKKADPVNPQFTEDFLEYAQARGFEIDPARVRKPKDKARVERQVRYVRGNYFAGEDFRSVEEARIEARRWCCEDAGMRTHGRTRRRPLEAFEADEKPLLLPAPTERYDQPRWSDHHVGRDHAVVVDYALYSVPYALGECDLRVRSDRKTVKLYKGARLVKTHPRHPPGGTCIDGQDLPPGKAALATRDATSLCEQGDRHGPHVGEYARRLADGPLPWSRIRHVYRLLGLARRFGSAATDEACARALEVDVVDVTRVQRMLENGLVRRGLLTATPTPEEPAGTVLRFQRPKDAFRAGDPDATA
ncbi:MAG: IS21 family transposase [Myxococcota bacterium]